MLAACPWVCTSVNAWVQMFVGMCETPCPCQEPARNNAGLLGNGGEQTWDTTGAPGAAATLVCVCAAGWEVGWAWAWGVMTMGVCCGAVTATVGATGPFWKSKE